MSKETFDINNYKGKYVMHCDTKYKANIFCKYLNSLDRKRNNGKSYLDNNNWEIYKENTCYCFNNDICGLNYFIKNHYTILEFNNFDWNDKMFLKDLSDDFTGTTTIEEGKCYKKQLLNVISSYITPEFTENVLFKNIEEISNTHLKN